MRQLITNDIFKMSRILKKINLDIKEIQKEINSDETKEDDSDLQITLSVLKMVIENAYLAQNEINDFIGDLCGMTGESFGKLPITESIKYFQELKNLDGISDFFKRAGRLTNLT